MDLWGLPSHQLNARTIREALQTVVAPVVAERFQVVAVKCMFNDVSEERSETQIAARRRSVEVALQSEEEVSYFL